MGKKKDTRGDRVILSQARRKKLMAYLCSPEVSAKQARRGRIIEMLADGWSQVDVSRALRAGIATIGRIRRRYLKEGLDAAVFGYAAPGRAKQITEADEAKIVAMVCADPPDGRARWTAELIVCEAQRAKIVQTIGRESVRLILKRHGMKPWLKKMWCVPKIDDEYRERMGDVLDLYAKPYDAEEPVICMDEKPTQLLSTYRPQEKCSDGSIREDYEYRRRGTASIFCCVEPKKGRHIVHAKARRCGTDFAEFMLAISKRYRNVNAIHIVMDNLNTHGLKSLVQKFGETKGKAVWSRFHVHYTPKHASWLNQAEIQIGLLERECLAGRRLETLARLTSETEAWAADANARRRTMNWQYTRNDAKRKFGLKTTKIKRGQH